MAVNHEDRLIWLGGSIMPVKDAKINVLSPTSQFGANVFEGIRCYWNEEEKELYAFRLKEHYDRLMNSIKIFKMDNPFSREEMQKALVDVVCANGYREDIAVRQTVFIDGFGTWSSPGPVNMFVAPVAKGRKEVSAEGGLNCCISSWERISEKNLSPRVKVGANYINSRMAQMQALESGFDSAIFMNYQGKVSEGPGSCLFMIRDGKLITPPCTASVLESITRKTVIELAGEELGIEVVEREIDRTELYICEGAFLCGSAMEVHKIASVDHYEIGNSQSDELIRKLHVLYLRVVSGQEEKYKSWLTPVYEGK